MIIGQFFFPRESHSRDVASRTRFASDALAEIVHDDIVKTRFFLQLNGDGSILCINSVKHFDEIEDANGDARFFEQFASDSLLQRLTEFQRAPGDGPLSAQRLAAAADQQRAALLDDHTTDTNHWPFGVLSWRSHG